MKTMEFTLNEQTLHLCFNGAALFDVYEKFGTLESVLDPIQSGDKQAYDAICWYLWKLSEQGELVRRYLGHERGRMLPESAFRALLMPTDVPRAKLAITNAVAIGFGMEIQEKKSGPVDLGLQALEKKTDPGRPAPGIIRWFLSFWGWISGKACS